MSWPHAAGATGGSCISNICMKLWFESWNLNATVHRQPRPRPRRRHPQFAHTRENGLAVKGRRADSAANNFVAKCEERPMDFNMSDRQREWLNRVQSFMHKHVRP